VDHGTGVTGEVDTVVVVNTMFFGSQAAYHVSYPTDSSRSVVERKKISYVTILPFLFFKSILHFPISQHR
jgi:hypothetical protein